MMSDPNLFMVILSVIILAGELSYFLFFRDRLRKGRHHRCTGSRD